MGYNLNFYSSIHIMGRVKLCIVLLLLLYRQQQDRMRNSTRSNRSDKINVGPSSYHVLTVPRVNRIGQVCQYQTRWRTSRQTFLSICVVSSMSIIIIFIFIFLLKISNLIYYHRPHVSTYNSCVRWTHELLLGYYVLVWQVVYSLCIDIWCSCRRNVIISIGLNMSICSSSCWVVLGANVVF